MVVFTKEFGTLDPHLPIVWDKVPKKRFVLTPSLNPISNHALLSRISKGRKLRILGVIFLPKQFWLCIFFVDKYYVCS